MKTHSIEKMNTCLLLILFIGVYIDNANGNCFEFINSIPNQIRVAENKTGLQFSFRLNESEKIVLEVTKLNGLISTKKNRDYVQGHFNLTFNNNTDMISLYIQDPLDLEDLHKYIRIDVISISLKFQCGSDSSELPVIVVPVDEFPPKFMEKPYSISVQENTPVGTSVFDVSKKVKDMDIRGTGSFSFYIERYTIDHSVDGYSYFKIEFAGNGIVTIKKFIDFDALKDAGKPTYFILRLSALGISGLKSTTTLNVSITDIDDQGPVFSMCKPPCRAQYRANTDTKYRGNLNVQPVPVSAADPDSFNNSIIYTLETVAYNSLGSFSIDRLNGQVSQEKDVFMTGVLTIKATENSAKGLSNFATILVALGNDTTAPPPAAKKSTSEDSGNLKLALIILAVVALLIIVGIIIVFAVYHKKVVKAVRPSDDSSEEISHSQNWQGSKTELLADEMSNPAFYATLQGRGNTLPPMTKDSATGTGKKRSRRRNKNKEPEIFDGTREYEGKLDLEFFNDANTKSKIKQSTRSRDTKTDPKYWITIPNDDE